MAEYEKKVRQILKENGYQKSEMEKVIMRFGVILKQIKELQLIML